MSTSQYRRARKGALVKGLHAGRRLFRVIVPLLGERLMLFKFGRGGLLERSGVDYIEVSSTPLNYPRDETL